MNFLLIKEDGEYGRMQFDGLGGRASPSIPLLPHTKQRNFISPSTSQSTHQSILPTKHTLRFTCFIFSYMPSKPTQFIFFIVFLYKFDKSGSSIERDRWRSDRSGGWPFNGKSSARESSWIIDRLGESADRFVANKDPLFQELKKRTAILTPILRDI